MSDNHIWELNMWEPPLTPLEPLQRNSEEFIEYWKNVKKGEVWSAVTSEILMPEHSMQPQSEG